MTRERGEKTEEICARTGWEIPCRAQRKWEGRVAGRARLFMNKMLKLKQDTKLYCIQQHELIVSGHYFVLLHATVK